MGKKCKCGKEMVFVEIVKRDGSPGKVPLDLKATVYEVTQVDEKGVPTFATRADKKYAVSHFNTCMNAAEFSKGGGGADTRHRPGR